MARNHRNSYVLFSGIIDLFREVAEFLLTDEGLVAQRARQRLNSRQRSEAKGDVEAGFFARLNSDLGFLTTTLARTPKEYTVDSTCLSTEASNLLNVIQEHFLVDSEESSSDDEAKSTFPYQALERLLDERDEPEAGSSMADRASWLCEELKITKTKTASRTLLLSSIKRCQDKFGPLSKANSEILPPARENISDSLWKTPLFANAENLHSTLSSTWDCDCFTNRMHQDAIFSFQSSSTPEASSSVGIMYFRTEENDAFGWKHTSFEYDDSCTASDFVDSAEKYGSRVQSGIPQPQQFCSVLDCATADDLVRINSGSSVWHHRSAVERCEANLADTLPLSSCFDLPQDHPVYNLPTKQRMMLALYLAHAYLHLGGGSWWPYTVRSSVLLPNNFDEDAPPLAFFSATILQSHDKCTPETEFEIVEQLNRDMPSLVAYGKLLLELWVGHKVIWEGVKVELSRLAGEAFGLELTGAIKACLKPTPWTDEPLTIRQNERTREAFISEVILPVQHVLLTGYKITAQDIFSAPPMRKASVVIPKVIHKRIKQRQQSIPAPEHYLITADYCLHDGDDHFERLEDNSGRDADAYMDQLQTCVTTMYDKLDGICPEVDEGYSTQPVKVAILDTGAYMSRDNYKHAYSGRLKECRTWLNTAEADGEVFALGSSDDDGHGTHGASVLLQATRSTDVHVYVAQVFSGRNEKVVENVKNMPTVDRIVNAIIHAVRVWKVDIISMSFGFSNRVPDIDAAITLAVQHNVVLLAAASNCGGNARVSWPARDDRIFCIYASTGIGNKYPRNPAATRARHNFAVLGTAVKALWPRQEDMVRKSGTSTATPICAAIVAVIISVLRRSENKYIAAHRRVNQNDLSIDELRNSYRAKLEVLGRHSTIASILHLMVAEGNNRDGYDYITPWHLFNKERGAVAIIEDMLTAIDA